MNNSLAEEAFIQIPAATLCEDTEGINVRDIVYTQSTIIILL